METMKERIKEQLNDLSLEDLKQVDHILSSYKKLPTAGQSSKVPMYFLGRFLGINQLGDGKAEMQLGQQNANTYGVAQGGSIYTLADISIGFMILNQLSEGQKVFTLEMKVNFINKGVGTRLISIPTILRQGGRTVVAESTIEDDDGNIVAKALGTFYVVG